MTPIPTVFPADEFHVLLAGVTGTAQPLTMILHSGLVVVDYLQGQVFATPQPPPAPVPKGLDLASELQGIITAHERGGPGAVKALTINWLAIIQAVLAMLLGLIAKPAPTP